MKPSRLVSVGALATLATLATREAGAREAPDPASPSTTATAATPPPPTTEVEVPPGCVLVPTRSGGPMLDCPSAGAAAEPEEPSAPPPTHRWYGGYVLAADGASLVVGLTGVLAPPMILVGFASYVLASPIIHWSRGHVATGFASMGLRVGAIVTTTVAGIALSAARCSGDFAGLCTLAYTTPLVVGGMAAATTIDAAVLARDSAPAPGAPSARHSPPSRRAAITLVPTLAITPTVQQAGVGGTF